MSADKTRTAWIMPFDAAHTDALRVAGASHMIRIDNKTKTWRNAVKLVRPGDAVYVWALVRVPTKRGGDEVPPVAQVREIVREIEDRGGVLIEVYTGRKSSKPKDKAGMIADAVLAMKSAGRRRMPGGYRKAGRRPRAFTTDEMRHAENVWRDVVKYPSWKFVEQHMPEGFTTARAFRLWGGRGSAQDK